MVIKIMIGLKRNKLKTKDFLSQPNQAGFTIVEIIAAVVILGMSLTTLIGIQSNYLDAYLRDDARTKASLYGQYILTMLEVEPEPPQAGKKSGKLSSYLDSLNYFDKNLSKESVPEIEDWEYTLESSDFMPFGEQTEASLRKVVLSISWGETIMDEFKIIYYMKVPAKLS